MVTETRQERKAREEAEASAINKKLEGVVLFPGSVQEYEQFVGYKVDVINTQRKDKGVFQSQLHVLPYSNYERGVYTSQQIDAEYAFAQNLIDQGIEGIVNVTFQANGNMDVTNSRMYGLPVRKSRNTP